MFKQIITAAVTTFVTVSASANTLELDCGPTRSVVRELYEKFSEVPTMYLKSDNTTLILFHNKSTGTWSILAADMAPNESCLIASGQGIEPVDTKKYTQPKKSI